MDRLRQLILEMHRRSIWQVLSVYLLGAWIAYEVILNLTEGMGLPAWVPPLALALFIIGLPMVLATAMVQEGGPGQARTAGVEGIEHATELLEADERAAPQDADADGARSVLTWRRFFIAGLGGFLLLGAGTAGFMGMRTLGIGPVGTLVAKGVLEAREPVVLASFENRTRDPFLAAAVTEALRVDLHASPVLVPLDPARVARVMERMRRVGDTLDLALAREIAVREGLKAAVGGEVAALGGGIVVTARVVAAGDGAVLASFRETARDSTGVIDAVDRLSRALRAKAGESLSAVRASPPLEEVTTSSLEALRLYARAADVVAAEGNYMRAAQLYDEAIRLDSTFAMAHRKLGAMLINMGIQRSRYLKAFDRAYALRHRLTARERGLAEGMYHGHLARDRARAIEAYRNLLASYPDDNAALNNLADLLLDVGDHGEAARVAARALERDPAPQNVVILTMARTDMGDVAGARAAIETGDSIFPGNVLIDHARYGLVASQGEFARADSMARAMAAARPGNVVAVGRSLLDRVHFAAARGMLRQQQDLFQDLADVAEYIGAGGLVLERGTEPALAVLTQRGDRDAALAMLDDVFQRFPPDTFPPADRPYLHIAEIHARAGEIQRAEALLQEWEAEPTPYDPPYRAALVRALIRAAAGDVDDAIRLLRDAEPTGCRLCLLPDLAMMYERAGMADSAVVVYERYLETPDFFRYQADAFHLGPVLERLAGLHDDRGARGAAASYYARFVELWQDADPELQPRVDAARRRLQRLAAEATGVP